MTSERIAAFSDGVFAIIITIMVLELKVPHGADVAALSALLPIFLTYVLSFILLGIYWNNHHHMLFLTDRITGSILWANLHLLFWLSLMPFVTGWMGENHFTALPTALYGFVLLMSSVAYWFLLWLIRAEHGQDSKIATALGSDWKGEVSPVCYLCAIGLAFVNEMIAGAIYVAVAAMWFIPDRRLARAAGASSEKA